MKIRAQWPFYCLLALSLYVLLEGFSFAAAWMLDYTIGYRFSPNPSVLSADQRALVARVVQTGGFRTKLDAELGWVPLKETNSAGMRDDREYQFAPPNGVLRISAFGDSFTYGDDVKLEESWTRRLSTMRPSLEVLNYGVSGYGLDQAYLRYRRLGAEYQPHIVFIGYLSENIARNVNVLRVFYSGRYPTSILTKPRFKVSDGHLVLLENPLPTRKHYAELLRNDRKILAQLGQNDFHYQTRYNEGVP